MLPGHTVGIVDVAFPTVVGTVAFRGYALDTPLVWAGRVPGPLLGIVSERLDLSLDGGELFSLAANVPVLQLLDVDLLRILASVYREGGEFSAVVFGIPLFELLTTAKNMGYMLQKKVAEEEKS